MTLAQNSPDASQLAKKFIDGSLKGRTKPPSKAAYARAVKLARQAIEDLTHVARRAGEPTR
jgi:hypothetical protein